MTKSPLVNKIIQTEAIKDFLSVPGKIYTFLNPVSYLDALKNQELFAKFDGIFADGSLLVNAIRHAYGEQVTRRSGDMTSMIPLIFSHAIEHNQSIYFVASKQQEVETAVQILQEKFPGANIIGYRNGYFSGEDEMRTEAKHIAQDIKPDFLIVGMGAVMQERFLLMVKEAGFQGIGFTCGGFIHQTSKGVDENYYPRWIDRLNLRFVYRMYREPHTRRRYAIAAFAFPYHFWKERLFH